MTDGERWQVVRAGFRMWLQKRNLKEMLELCKDVQGRLHEMSMSPKKFTSSDLFRHPSVLTKREREIIDQLKEEYQAKNHPTQP